MWERVGLEIKVKEKSSVIESRSRRTERAKMFLELLKATFYYFLTVKFS